jgi:hypothetical protein
VTGRLLDKHWLLFVAALDGFSQMEGIKFGQKPIILVIRVNQGTRIWSANVSKTWTHIKNGAFLKRNTF